MPSMRGSDAQDHELGSERPFVPLRQTMRRQLDSGMFLASWSNDCGRGDRVVSFARDLGRPIRPDFGTANTGSPANTFVALLTPTA